MNIHRGNVKLILGYVGDIFERSTVAHLLK